MLANTWAAVYRGETLDVLGDPIGTDIAVTGLERVPMSITEKSRRIYDPESDELRTIRYGVGRAKPGTDVRRGDRLLDSRTGKWWAVREVGSGAPSFTGLQDLSFDLRAV